MYRMFPRLKERQHTQAGVLSGGEQQMLTLCRSLLGNPELIMIDEPTEGLAPKIVELVARYLQELKARGISVLLIEQKLAIALEISQRVYMMGHGADRLRRHARRSWPKPPPSGANGWKSESRRVTLDRISGKLRRTRRREPREVKSP